MGLEVWPPRGEETPVHASPLSPRTVQLSTFWALQLTLEVLPLRTSEGMTRRSRMAPAGGGGAGGGCCPCGNSLNPAVAVQSGSSESMRPSPSLSALSVHWPAGGCGSAQENVSVAQSEVRPPSSCAMNFTVLSPVSEYVRDAVWLVPEGT